MSQSYDLIVVGSGAAGMIAAITAARDERSVLLLEKLPKLGAKLKATGGGRCNLTNTLDNDAFMAAFGRQGRFMTPALEAFDHQRLRDFFSNIGVETHAPDGMRVFPLSHSSQTILTALEEELIRLGVEIHCSSKAERIRIEDHHILGVDTLQESFSAANVIIATGGLGYPTLGAEGDGYAMARSAGHTITQLYPAMMPLRCKEEWVGSCKADTIAKVELRVDLPKAKKLRANGDLIFTNTGIRGPVVLDFAREITPFLKENHEVPILMNLTKGMNEDDLHKFFKARILEDGSRTVVELVHTLLPLPLSQELCKLAQADLGLSFSKQSGTVRDRLIKILAWTPLTVTGHDGFKMAMITRGGVSLKEIEPLSMQSKIVKGLYFCGEVMDLDGPCGGYNLQWSFSSGVLAGKLKG